MTIVIILHLEVHVLEATFPMSLTQYNDPKHKYTIIKNNHKVFINYLISIDGEHTSSGGDVELGGGSTAKYMYMQIHVLYASAFYNFINYHQEVLHL